MARQFDVQYISAYTDGSAARKLELPKPRKSTRRKPSARRSKKIVLYVDPLAILGILVAGIMMIALTVGVCKLVDARQEMLAMDSYVQTLRQENAQLQEEYEAGYDLEDVRQTALALGMVPAEQAQHVQVQVQIPQPEQPSGWEQIRTFLAGLFA